MRNSLVFVIIFLFVAAIGVAACSVQPPPADPAVQPPASTIDSFEECAAAGNPIAESYPRQCRTPDGQMFTEEIEGGALPPDAGINSFEECAAAGNPIAESYPRQCRTPDGQMFTEEIEGGVVPPDAGINSFEECAAAGNPIMESYPRQCRAPDGQTFVEDVGGVATAEVSTVVPDDPSTIGLSKYPDEPLDSIPTEPISVTYLIEHRSALNGETVTVHGIVVATLLGEKACPPDKGMCAHPSVFLADTSAEDRDPYYDVQILVGEQEQEADYPIGKVVQTTVNVQADRTVVILFKIYVE